jgi:predicted anti-sigma-YlaC factor YlaD
MEGGKFERGRDDAEVVVLSDRVTALPQGDDEFTTSVVRRVVAADRAQHPLLVRVLLGVVAVQLVTFGTLDLVRAIGAAGGDASHDLAHLGAFTVAYGVLLFVVAVRPARARTALPVSVVLGSALAVTAVVDVIGGRAPLVAEARHLSELLGVVLVVLLARAGSRPRRSGILGG